MAKSAPLSVACGGIEVRDFPRLLDVFNLQPPRVRGVPLEAPMLRHPIPSGLTSEPDEFLLTTAAAELLHVAPRTLERMRSEGSGPPFVKAGRRCLYRRSSLMAWAEARSFTSTSEAKRRAATG